MEYTAPWGGAGKYAPAQATWRDAYTQPEVAKDHCLVPPMSGGAVDILGRGATLMRYGVHVPIFNEYADPRRLAELARDAEEAGWDGFFLWDHIMWHAVDPWVALTAIALNTERIHFGPLVTPLPRRRPWKVARETVSLDRLSGGRLILGVGIGGGPDEFDYLGEEPDPKVRGAMLDEGLELLTRLWSGQVVQHDGQFYHVRHTQFTPTPIQQPRIPIWVAGMWPNKAPFRRATRWDGACPQGRGLPFDQQMSPQGIAEVVAYIAQQGAPPIELIHEGFTPGHDRPSDAATVAAYAAVGVTWWMENVSPWRYGWNWQGPYPVEQMRARVRGGPPRVD